MISILTKKLKTKKYYSLAYPFLQISVATKDLLEKEGSFNYIKRETTNPKLRADVVTYWLIGRKTGQNEAKTTAGTEAESKATEK